MKDVNKKLRSKLYALLQPALTDVPVYYKYIPAAIDSSAYVLITTVNSSDISTMHSSDTDTTIQIGIYTKDSQANAGAQCDDIAAIVYNTIYPTPQSKIDLSPDFQNCVLRLANDVSPDAIQTGSAIFINRFISFRLNIFTI